MMNKPNKTPGTSRKRRLSVEVYFVLYLSAIILLLGTTPSSKEYDAQLETAVAELINTDFQVDVQKIALVVPFMPAGMGGDSLEGLLPRDTMNLIRAHGSFSSVSFRIVAIEDTSTGSTLPAERGYLTKESDSSVTFHWTRENDSTTAVYRVAIEAIAEPKIPDNVSSPKVRERIREVVAKRALMRDTAFFSINVIPATSPEYLLAVRNAPTLDGSSPIAGGTDSALTLEDILAQLQSRGPGNGFSASASSNVVTAPPGGTWEQRVGILGTTETGALKIARSSGASNVRITAQSSNSITISGTAPRGANEENEVLVVITTPNQEQSMVSFLVRASQLDDPAVPRLVYSGETYDLDFGSSGIERGRITVSVNEEGRSVAENHSPRISYTPRATSGTVIFSRFVDGKLYDSQKAEIRQLPNPIISDRKSEKEGEVIVEVTAYGTVNGRPNLPILRVHRGNAAPPQKLSENVDKVNHRTRATYRIVPDNASEGFEFTLRVWDLRGPDYSNELTYKQ